MRLLNILADVVMMILVYRLVHDARAHVLVIALMLK